MRRRVDFYFCWNLVVLLLLGIFFYYFTKLL